MSTSNKPDRFQTFNYMFDVGFNEYDMTTSERLVFCALWRNANPKGYCTVSYGRIKSLTGMSCRTIRNCIKRFIDLEIIRVHQKSTRDGRSTTYQIVHIPYKKLRKNASSKTSNGSQ